MILNKNIKTIINKMTLEEKVSLCSGKTKWSTEDIKRLNIPSIKMFNGPHGMRVETSEGKVKKATCFPTASALASSWDADLVYEVGKVIGKECRNLGANIMLGPGINIKRNPLCGRNFEYYSEDPWLTGEIGSAFVNGVQSQGVGTSLKHYACNTQDYKRKNTDTLVRERALREIYLLGFEKVVKQAHPWTVMSAYNSVNGTNCSENQHLLNEILKQELGFESVVVSDWTEIEDKIEGIKAGMDLEMPGPAPENDELLLDAVKNGTVKEETLDNTVERILKLVFKAHDKTEKTQENINFEKHHGKARKTLAESMVLLKNDNDLLPLNQDMESIAVIGKIAEEPAIEGGGSSIVYPTRIDIPLDEIKDKLGDRFDITYAKGYKNTFNVDEMLNLEEGKQLGISPEEESNPIESQTQNQNKTNQIKDDEILIQEAGDKAKKADIALVFAGLPGLKEFNRGSTG